LKTQVPETFPPAERVEVATQDESFHVLLSEKDGNLTRQDSKTIFAMLDPMKLLGPSAFGPLKFRAVSPDGVAGDWQLLANLVRMPDLKEVRCTAPVKSAGRSPGAEKRPAREEGSIGANSKSEKNGGSENSLVSQKAEQSSAPEKSAVAESPSGPEKPIADKQCTLSGDKLFLIDAVSADPDFTNSVTVPDGFVEAALAIPAPKGKALYLKLRDDPGTVDTAVVPILTAQP
jgi:hypothetical protein